MKCVSWAVTKMWFFFFFGTVLEKQAGVRHERKQHFSSLILGFLCPTEMGGVKKKKSHTESCCLSLSDQSALLPGPTQEETLPCSSQCQTSKHFIAENRNLCIWQRGKPRQAKVMGFAGEPIGNGSQGWITENRLCVFSESSPAGCIVWLALRGWQDSRAQLKHWNHELPSFQIFG